jgi:hypothetical protein
MGRLTLEGRLVSPLHIPMNVGPVLVPRPLPLGQPPQGQLLQGRRRNVVRYLKHLHLLNRC